MVNVWLPGMERFQAHRQNLLEHVARIKSALKQQNKPNIDISSN